MPADHSKTTLNCPDCIWLLVIGLVYKAYPSIKCIPTKAKALPHEGELALALPRQRALICRNAHKSRACLLFVLQRKT